VIELTREYTRNAAARAVPGAYFEDGAWRLDDPEPRAAVVALKLFPELLHTHPELVELRDSVMQNAQPVDYATKLGIRIGAPRVRAAMAERGWCLSKSKANPVGVGEDYQEVDLGFAAAVLREHGAFYLGWARGLGKTIGTAAIIDDLDLKSTLVVAPNTAKASTWADELAWACPWLEVIVLPNDAAKRVKALERAQYLHREGEPFVLVIHFEALALIAGKQTHHHKTGRKLKTTKLLDGWKKLKIDWDLKAADEGHRFANPDSLMSRAAGRVPAKMAMVMSGSVFQNRFEEMYGPLHFLYPARYKSRWRDWNDRFGDYVENGYGKICVGLLEHKLDAMRDELGRFMVVRDKENKALEETITVELSPSQRQVYEDLAEMLLAELPDGTRLKAGVGIALLTRLRQIATGLDVLCKDVQDSSKIDACIAKIKEHWDRGDTYLVFGWYKASLRSLAARLAESGIDTWVIDGDVPQKERTEIVRAFQNGQKRVLLGSISTMSESLNLQVANHIVMLDRSFNPATNQQAVDRADRQGQQRTVYLTQIVAKNTVDDLVVLPNLSNKEAMRAVILGGQ
jgi:SNF2 family DNA or RNA helicase